jgi:hypothetical protein
MKNMAWLLKLGDGGVFGLLTQLHVARGLFS